MDISGNFLFLVQLFSFLYLSFLVSVEPVFNDLPLIFFIPFHFLDEGLQNGICLGTNLYMVDLDLVLLKKVLENELSALRIVSRTVTLQE